MGAQVIPQRSGYSRASNRGRTRCKPVGWCPGRRRRPEGPRSVAAPFRQSGKGVGSRIFLGWNAASRAWHHVPTSLFCSCFSICDFVVQVVAWKRSTYFRRRGAFPRQVEDSLHRCRRVFPVHPAVVASQDERVLLIGTGHQRRPRLVLGVDAARRPTGCGAHFIRVNLSDGCH